MTTTFAPQNAVYAAIDNNDAKYQYGYMTRNGSDDDVALIKGVEAGQRKRFTAVPPGSIIVRVKASGTFNWIDRKPDKSDCAIVGVTTDVVTNPSRTFAVAVSGIVDVHCGISATSIGCAGALLAAELPKTTNPNKYVRVHLTATKEMWE